MTFRHLWAELRLELHRFQTIKHGSQLYQSLIASGVDRRAVDSYIECGRGRKHPRISATENTDRQVQELIALGGHVAGGAALRRFMDLDGARDYDVFFADLPSFVSAHLAVYTNPNIDVCLFKSKPFELFDLAASKCSYSSSGFDVDPSFNDAMVSGISDIDLNTIVHPTATLRRVSKYGARYGFGFPVQKLLLLAATSGVDEAIAGLAMRYAI